MDSGNIIFALKLSWMLNIPYLFFLFLNDHIWFRINQINLAIKSCKHWRTCCHLYMALNFHMNSNKANMPIIVLNCIG